MAEEAFEATADPEKLSFFGLAHWLGEVTRLLDRVDDASLAKNPSAEEQKLVEQKDELLEAQSRLRRTMGALLESPSLTKREKPLAQDFLTQQIDKLEKASAAAGSGSAAEKKAAKATEKLRQILEEVGKKKAAPETRETQEIEACIKSADADWKEVSPIYDKWHAGRHSFKTNEDLQAMKRKYDNAKKARESGPQRLHKALCATREGKAVAVPVQETGPPKGWFSSSAPKKAVPAGRAKAATRRPAQPNAWGSAVMSFAQRLRAEASAQVRQGVDEEFVEEEDDDGDAVSKATEVQRAPVKPKGPPPLPRTVDDDGFTAVKPGAGARQAPVPKQQVLEEDEEDEEETSSRLQATYKASAKKTGKAGKGKKGKKSGHPEDDDVPEDVDVPAQKVRKPAKGALAVAAEAAVSGSVLQELSRSSAWSLPEDEAAAEERLSNLGDRLSWVSPLGLALPLEWKEFFSLEIDGGPRRTSRRGESQFADRIKKNVGALLAHYLTVLFGICFLHALSHFGLMMWGFVVQMALILAPPDIPYPRSQSRVLILQGAHLVLWLLFLRSLWQFHVLVKCFLLLLIGGHSYVATPLGEA